METVRADAAAAPSGYRVHDPKSLRSILATGRNGGGSERSEGGGVRGGGGEGGGGSWPVPDCDAERWRVEEVGDGNLNLVFIVRSPPDSDKETAIVAKQALPYVRCVGESWPLSPQRAYFEHLALVEENRSAPGLVPEVLHFFPTDLMILMQYLHPHIILRKGVIKGILYPNLAEHMARFLASTLYSTSKWHRRGPEKGKSREELLSIFAGNDMYKITEQVIFIEPFIVATNNRWTTPQLDKEAADLREDEVLQEKVAELKRKFVEDKEALLHADLHTGSLMVTPQDTKVIDPEFAFFGPMGFDVGLLLGNLFLGYFSQRGHASSTGGDRDEYKEWMLATIAGIWTGFESSFLKLWRDEAAASSKSSTTWPSSSSSPASTSDEATMQVKEMERLLRDSLAFAGCAVIRRIVGLAHAEELESLADADVRAACERRALAFGKYLVKEAGSITRIETAIAKVKEFEQK